MIVLTCDRCGKTIKINEKLYDIGFAPWHHTASGYKINLNAAQYPEGLQLCEKCLEDITDYAYQPPENKCECCYDDNDVVHKTYEELTSEKEKQLEDFYKTETYKKPTSETRKQLEDFFKMSNLNVVTQKPKEITSKESNDKIEKITYDAELSALEKLKEQFSNKVNNLNQKVTPSEKVTSSEKVASSNISHEDELTKKYNDFIETMTKGDKTFGDILSGVHNFCNKLTDEDRDFINKMVMKDLKKTMEEMF